MNTLFFNKEISNFDKLNLELEQITPQYDFYTSKGAELALHFKVPIAQLGQTLIDQISDHVNDFVEVSLVEMEYETTTQKTSDGFGIYRQIIADINTSGGLGGYLDEETMPFYQLLRPVRDMLKDGFFEFAIRYFTTDIEPLNVLPEEKSELYKQWIGELAIKYGSDAQLIEMLKTVPKNQFPFGSVGAP